MSQPFRKDIPLNGKLITADPSTIDHNFQQLTNMRYTDTHPESVRGMTKINTNALTTYLKTRSAFHFVKSQPAESHVLIQAYNADLTASRVLENKTAIPGTGSFEATELWIDSSGAGLGRFANASDGQMIYCNGVDTCIWGGDEINAGAFITSTAVVTDSGSPTNPKNYTDVVNNTKQDSANCAIIGGGNDTYTKLLLHGDGADASTTITDSAAGGGGAKTVTAVADAQIDTAQAKFGTGSIYFDGTGDYLTTVDHADWFMSTGNFTIDFWVRFEGIVTAKVLFGQYVDANNYVEAIQNYSPGTLTLTIVSGGVTTVNLTGTFSLSAATWYHVAFIRGWGGVANAWAITVNGAQIGVTLTDADPWPDLAAPFNIGKYASGSATYMYGWIDEFRVSKGIARWVSNFTVSSVPYSAVARTWLVGSVRPLKGIKYYIAQGNADASTMTCKEWSGTTWNSLTITDNTDTGASLATTGTVTFSSTVSSAKPRYIEGYFLYWYQCSIDAGQALIYHVTLDAPFQNIIDSWDGVFRDVSAFLEYKTNYLDNTMNVLREDYDSATASTYYAIGGLVAFSDPNNCLNIGFSEKQTGIKITVIVPNAVASTLASVDYWNGSGWQSVGVIVDGTSEGGVSLANSGVISWNNSNIFDETQKVVSNGILRQPTYVSSANWLQAAQLYLIQKKEFVAAQSGLRTPKPHLYHYRLKFDKTITAGARIDYIGGISAPNTISHYKFPVFAQGRTLLCCDMAGDKNKVLVSSKYMPQVYNGSDSIDIYFGEEGELTCGVELFSQFGSSLYSLILMFKDNETWMVAGQDIYQWENNIFLLAGDIGCPAPLTLKTINPYGETATGVSRTMAIWQDSHGIYTSDGRAPVPIHGDIKEYFDPSDSRCIKASMVGDSAGWINPVTLGYHWKFASGSSATDLNKEMVYDTIRKKWHEIERGTGKSLQCGLLVHDTYGNAYNYGFIDMGYMEHLENGTDFDGEDIVSTMWFGDMVLTGKMYIQSRIEEVLTFVKAKTTTANLITVTHYGDTQTSGQSFTLSPVLASHRLLVPMSNKKEMIYGDFIFHSLKYVMVTDNETKGFEPLTISLLCKSAREV